MIEPNCDMPWEIYLDWLQDQGYEDLRDIPINSIIPCWPIYSTPRVGNGGLDEFYYSYSQFAFERFNTVDSIGDSICGSIGQGYGVDSFYLELDEDQYYSVELGEIIEGQSRGDGIDSEGQHGNGVGDLL